MFQRAQYHVRNHRSVIIFPVLILGLLFVGITATLTACDTAQVWSYGQVHALNGHFSESADSVKQAENCFWQAFQCEKPGTHKDPSTLHRRPVVPLDPCPPDREIGIPPPQAGCLHFGGPPHHQTTARWTWERAGAVRSVVARGGGLGGWALVGARPHRLTAPCIALETAGREPYS
jgi:hypothetical protein